MHRPDSYPPLASRLLTGLLAAVAVSACVPDFYDGLAPEDVLVVVGPETDPPPPTPLQSCAPEVQWVTERPHDWGMGVPFLDVTPNDGLLLRSDPLYSGETVVMRTSDGETLAEDYGRAFLAADSGWGRQVTVWWDRVTVSEMITGVALTEVMNAPDDAFEAAALDASGEKVAALSCHLGGQTLLTFDATTGAVEHEVELTAGSEDEWCSGMWEPMDQVLFVPGQNKVLVALGETGELVVVNLDDESVVRVVAHDPAHVAADDQWMLPAAILDVAVHPSGDRVASTGADGQVRVFDVPDLTARERAGQIGLVPVNLSAYATPRWTSDLAYSRDGALLVTVGTDNLPQLRDAGSLDVLATLDAGLEIDPDNDLSLTQGRPTGFAFSRHDEMLLVQYGNAFAGFACGPWKPQSDHPEAPMNVTLAVPSNASLGEEIVFTATHIGNPDVHSHTFFIDGERISGGGLSRTASFYPSSAGVYEVHVVVSDGIHSGSATRTLVVDE